MRRYEFLAFGLLLLMGMLSGCNTTLPAYEDDLERRIYGALLAEEEVEDLENTISAYAACMFSIEEGRVKEKELLKRVAPGEDSEEWERVYRLQKTSAALLHNQVLDIEVYSDVQANVLFLCIAKYQDIEIPEDDYYFVIQAFAWQEGGNWLIKDSKVLGTAKMSDADILRETFTGRIVFRPKEGE